MSLREWDIKAGHYLEKGPGRVRCKVCLRAWPRTAHLRVVQRDRCPGAFARSEEERRLLGKHPLHASHTLEVRRGVVMCVTCGAWAASAPRRLKYLCSF